MKIELNECVAAVKFSINFRSGKIHAKLDK